MRLLIVEDESELAALVAAALRKAGLIADVVGTLEDALTATAAVDYDAAVLDLGLPDGDGTALLRALRDRRSGTSVLVLTARDALESRIAGLDAGADDYLLKPFHTEELLARVRALLRRPRGPLATRLALGNVAFDPASREAEVATRPVALPRRELALLELLLRRAGRVVTREVIESQIYGFEDEVGPNALEVQVHRLRRRLAEAGATVTIHTLRGVGYMIEAFAP
jgi:DNA-binding response OmpR family regulator